MSTPLGGGETPSLGVDIDEAVAVKCHYSPASGAAGGRQDVELVTGHDAETMRVDHRHPRHPHRTPTLFVARLR